VKTENKPVKSKTRTGPKYAESEIPGITCTPPGIDDFPMDLFSPTQRAQGFVLVHFFVSMYIFYALALVCDDYFVPAMECICEGICASSTFQHLSTNPTITEITKA
jgi:hypothetical protein